MALHINYIQKLTLPPDVLIISHQIINISLHYSTLKFRQA